MKLFCDVVLCHLSVNAIDRLPAGTDYFLKKTRLQV